MAEKLRLSGATGVTAGNGGSAFSQEFEKCSGPGCWISGLAAEVSLPGGTVERVPFTVRVPAGTPPGQYLAGLTVEAASLPPSVQVGSNGKATARAVIIKRVTVGVAVTVGVGSRLTTRLAIPSVSGQAIGPTARLNIELAVIAVNAPGLPEGVAMPCTVRLRYGNSLTASWAGQVTVPAPPRARIVHTGPGAYSVVPAAGTPAWAVALLVIGALVLAALATVLLRLHRHSRVT